MPTTWKLDPSHTDITFAAKHMMVTTVRGKFANVDGHLTADRDDPTSARGEIEIDVASLNTGSEFRDNHLRSADFFDVESHPKARFVITAVEPDGDDYEITGDLTIRGVTQPVTLKAELLGFYTSMEGAPRVGFAAMTKLNRKDWGLNWNVALEQGGWLVGDEIKLTIDAAFEEAREARELSSAA
jgi:polyisoprenoid-binding protein YceI